MSWITCERCGDLIDTDQEPETYREQHEAFICNGCWVPPAEAHDPDAGDFPDFPLGNDTRKVHSFQYKPHQRLK